MAAMTSRERVACALRHEEPDRVPVDIGGGASSSIVVEGYEKLKTHVGASSDTRVLNRVFRVARIDDSVLDVLGADCRPLTLKPPENWAPPESAPGTFTDIWGLNWKEARYGGGCVYNELAESPLAKADVDALDRYPWPDPGDPGYTRGLAEEAARLFTGTPHAIVGDCGFKSFWELGYLLRGYDRFLVDLVDNPEFVDALLHKLLEINVAVTGRFLEAAGSFIHVIRTADDVATQRGLLMSPAMYRRFLKPVYRKYYDFIRSKTDASIFYHSCGNVTELLDDFVEIGVNIINPVQVSAMPDTALLKRRYGKRLVFWGGVDTQRVLPLGTVQEVEEEVRRRIRDLGSGGGYVLAAVHNIQPDVPPRNIVAMAEAARKYGTYPLRA